MKPTSSHKHTNDDSQSGRLNPEAAADGNAAAGAKKSRKKRRKRSRFNMTPLYLFAALGLIAVSVWLGMYFAGNTTIQSVMVKGHVYTPEDSVLNAADIETGIHADSVKVTGLIRNVEKLPYVRSASVYISPTGRFEISVREREPLAYLTQGDAMMMVDADGIKMPVHSSEIPDLPLLYGFNVNPASDTLAGPKFESVVAFLQAMHQNRIASLTISEVGWHPADGVIALSHENGVRMVFGETDFEPKLRNWSEFYRQVVPHKGMAAFTTLDFRFRDQIVAIET